MSEKSSPSSNNKVLWIVWGALLWGLFIYTIIAFFQGQTKPDDPKMLQTLLYAFSGAALMLTIALFMVVPRVLITKGDGSNQRYLTYCIVRWATSEAICVLGFAYKLMGGQLNAYLGFFALSVVLHLFNAPTQRDRDSFDKAAA